MSGSANNRWGFPENTQMDAFIGETPTKMGYHHFLKSPMSSHVRWASGWTENLTLLGLSFPTGEITKGISRSGKSHDSKPMTDPVVW